MVQKLLRGQDIEILEDIEIATLVQDSFWTNLVRVEVHGKARIAKIYGPSSGGKARFEKDLEFLAKHWLVPGASQGAQSDTSDPWRTPMVPHVLGYNARSQLPFVVLTSGEPLVWKVIDRALTLQKYLTGLSGIRTSGRTLAATLTS